MVHLAIGGNLLFEKKPEHHEKTLEINCLQPDLV